MYRWEKFRELLLCATKRRSDCLLAFIAATKNVQISALSHGKHFLAHKHTASATQYVNALKYWGKMWHGGNWLRGGNERRQKLGSVQSYLQFLLLLDVVFFSLGQYIQTSWVKDKMWWKKWKIEPFFRGSWFTLIRNDINNTDAFNYFCRLSGLTLGNIKILTK